MTSSNKNGQIGLMLLVVMGIVISIVLSIASRSLFDISLSRQEKENSSAFAIAESGVERALLSLSEGDTTGGSLADSTGVVTGGYGIVEMKSFDMFVKEGDAAQIDLTGAPSNVVLSWGKDDEDPGTCVEGSGTSPAAVEVILFSSTGVVTRAYYNSSGCDLSASNRFTNAGVGSGGYLSSQPIVTTSQVAMRIKPLYSGATISVTGNNLASQLYLIESKATGGDARSDIEAKRSLDAPPSVFDYAIFSNTTIIK